MRNRQLTRALCLYRLLAGKRRTLAAMAREFGVTTRTIRRDLDALEDAGIPLCKSRESDDAIDRAKFWWIAK